MKTLTCFVPVLVALLFCSSVFAQTSITPASHEVGAGVVPYQILVNSNVDWTATVDAAWVTLSRTSGSEDGNILVTAAANTTGADRIATITVNGATHTLAQRAAGVALQELWGFGSDNDGQLGDNVLLQRLRPGQVATAVRMVAAGEDHSLIVKTDGSLWAMGSNFAGQLGDGTRTARGVPVQILPGGVLAAAGGANHSLFVKTDGSLWAMGDNSYGQLGDGTTTQQHSPEPILSSGVQAVAAGYNHSLILKNDGSLWATGQNGSGQLGDGTTTDRNSPVSILSSGVRAVAAGYAFSLILKTDGSLWAMGANDSGQLGDGTTTQRNSPVPILSSGVQAVSAGYFHSLILKTDGSLWAMGSNNRGSLGDGTTNDRWSPVQVLSSGVQSVSAGHSFSLIVKTDGSLWATGWNEVGELGDGTTTQHNSPEQILSSGVQAVTASHGCSYIVKTDGSLWAMGSTGGGQLGDGRVSQRNSPVQILSGGIQAIAAGDSHSLIVKTDGSLWAVGRNDSGQLGDGTSTDRGFPVQILPAGVRAVAAGYYHSLIVKNDGSLWTTGGNSHGQLGDGTTNQQTAPEEILAGGVQAVAAGEFHSLILKTDGSLWAMGWNNFGQLGDGTTTDRWSPVPILSSGVRAVAAGANYSLFVKTDGSLWAMGSNGAGQLGDGTTTDRWSPVPILSSGVQAVAAGWGQSLILMTDGSLWAIGANESGELGDGTRTQRNSPVPILASGVQAIAAGHDHSLILKTDGSLWAMGDNWNGELGDGTMIAPNTPELIALNVQKIAAGSYFSLIVAGGDIGLHTPQITVQPQDQTVVVGAAVQFTVGGLGGGAFSYQWFKDGVSIGGATGNTLTLPNVTQADAGGYFVVVSNVVGTVTSRTASLVVNGPPAITAQSPNRAAPAGESTSFSVTVSGTAPFTYQWQRNGVNLVDGSGLSGATTATLVLGNVQPGDTGRYAVVIGNNYGTITSPAATLAMGPVYVFTTLAGRAPQAGSADGTGTAARFYNPGGIVWDATGNLVVADSANSTIRKITPAGVVTTLAGSAGNGGSADGTGSAARFGGLGGAAIDGAGNVYVTDNNNTVRKITSTGVVTTLAGLAGNSGTADGTGSAARFNGPGGVAIDLSGNLYVTDCGTTLRKITPTGVVTTLAGMAWNSGHADGTGSAAQFNGPRGIAVDPSGNVYVADGNNNTLRKVTPTGVVTTFAGLAGASGSTDGTGSAARFRDPGGLAFDGAGNLYVADSGNHTIRKMTPAGVVTTLAGLAGNDGDADGLGTAARFAFPVWVSVNAGGTVAVADSGNNTIRSITSAGLVRTLAGSSGGSVGTTDGPGATARFFGPNGAVRDADNNLYVLDNFNHSIRRVTPDGVVSTFADLTGFHTSEVRPGNFVPSGIARDSAGNFYVTDTAKNTVLKITPAGVPSTLATVTGGSGALTGLAVDHSGNVFVTDTWNHVIDRITPAGVVSVFAGQMGISGSADGAGTDAQLCGPSGLVIDGEDNLYLADTWNHVIRKITASGVVSTLTPPARSWAGPDAPDSVEAATRISHPTGIARDDAGNLYVTEYYGNARIWKVTPDGTMSWIGGRVPGTANGTGTAARFNYPSGIVVDTDGNLYITDFGNNTIRKGVPITPAILVPPASQTATVGQTATFSVATAGSGPFTYQWQRNGVDLVDGSGVSGSTSATLTLLNPELADAGSYTVVVCNSAGSAASSAATLTVISPDEAFLQRLFLDVLGREIDPGALSAFLAAMSGGRTRSEVYGDLVGSGEYNQRQIEPVIRLYYAALARPPDYTGLQNWSNALRDRVFTLPGAADQFVGSTEFLLRYGTLDNTGYVQQLYLNVLGRQADPAGLADWVGQLNAGVSRGTVLIGFSESPEFQADMASQVEIIRLYDLLLARMPTTAELQSWQGFLLGYDQTDTLFAQGYPVGLADTDYVSLVFQGFLRRTADPGALSAFGSALTAGTATHGSLVNTLLSSAEFNRFVAPVSRLYMAAFHRVPDAGGLDNWVAYVRAGNSLQSAADAFVASQEFQLTYGSLNDTQYVTLLYENVLGREPDPAGLATWTGLLGSGTSRGGVLIGFSESQEGMALFAPTVRTSLHYFTFLNATPAQADLNYWNNYLATLDDQMRTDLLADPAFSSGG